MSLEAATRMLIRESAHRATSNLLIVISFYMKAGATPRTIFSDGPYARQPLAGCALPAMKHRVTLRRILHAIDVMTHQIMGSRAVPRALRNPVDPVMCALVVKTVSTSP